MNRYRQQNWRNNSRYYGPTKRELEEDNRGLLDVLKSLITRHGNRVLDETDMRTIGMLKGADELGEIIRRTAQSESLVDLRTAGREAQLNISNPDIAKVFQLMDDGNMFEARRLWMQIQTSRGQFPGVPPERGEVTRGGFEISSPEDWWNRGKRGSY